MMQNNEIFRENLKNLEEQTDSTAAIQNIILLPR